TGDGRAAGVITRLDPDGAGHCHCSNWGIFTMQLRNLLPLVAASLLLSSAAAIADEAPMDWSGFYAGAIADVNFGNTHFALPGDTHDVLQQTHDKHTAFAG